MTHSGRKFNTLIIDLDDSQEWLNGRPYWKERMWHCRQKSALPRPPFGDGHFRSISEHTYRHKHGKCSMSRTVMLSSTVKPHRPESRLRGTIQSKAISWGYSMAWRYRNTSRYSHHLMRPLNLFTVLQLKTSQPLTSGSPVLAWKSLDSHSCIHLMKKGW